MPFIGRPSAQLTPLGEPRRAFDPTVKPAAAYKTGTPPMNNQHPRSSSASTPELDLINAVEHYIRQGGVINVVPLGETAESPTELALTTRTDAETEEDNCKKVELLKTLIAKGAGVNSLQYSLRMNRKDIKRMAGEQGLKILYNRPVRAARSVTTKEPDSLSDETAGLAMHYSSLGYSALEIAQKLRLSVRQVWRIGQDYRFEFKRTKDRSVPDQPMEE